MIIIFSIRSDCTIIPELSTKSMEDKTDVVSIVSED